jgi:hypothetical protein
VILEIARIVSEWFQHPEHGVNALLASTPRDAGDAVPPEIERFMDFTLDNEAALAQVPAETPALQLRVRFSDRIEGQMPSQIAECVADIYVRVTVKDDQAARGQADVLYTLRTCLRSFRRLMLNENHAARTRNQVQMYHAETIGIEDIIIDPRDPHLVTVLHAQVLARDLLPT